LYRTKENVLKNFSDLLYKLILFAKESRDKSRFAKNNTFLRGYYINMILYLYDMIICSCRKKADSCYA